MINEVLLVSVLAVCMFCALIGFISAWLAHARISELKSETELHTKDIVYQTRERLTSMETKMRERDQGFWDWKADMQGKVNALEDSLCG